MRYLFFSSIPFEHETIPDEKTIVRKNLFNNNVGNTFFFNAVVRSLLCKENELIRYKPGFDMDSCDAGILVHANSIRNGTAEWFENDYQTIKNSKIPFVLVSVGSDSDSNFETHLEENVIRSIYRCYSLILERVPSIGVRGDMTKKILVEQVGIPSDRIDVIGCPSLRYFGTGFRRFSGEYRHYCKEMKIAVNFTGYHYDNDEAVYLYQLLKEHPHSFVIFTDKVEAELLWYGTAVPVYRRHDLLPGAPDHFIMRENRARFSACQNKIMDMFRTFDFSIGSRIHQAVVALLSGCPAILIAHSSRVLEIAQHHNIPYILRSELVQEQPSVEALYYRACLGMRRFYDSYDEKLIEYTDFLQKNFLKVNPDFLFASALKAKERYGNMKQ